MGPGEMREYLMNDPDGIHYGFFTYKIKASIRPIEGAGGTTGSRFPDATPSPTEGDAKPPDLIDPNAPQAELRVIEKAPANYQP